MENVIKHIVNKIEKESNCENKTVFGVKDFFVDIDNDFFNRFVDINFDCVNENGEIDYELLEIEYASYKNYEYRDYRKQFVEKIKEYMQNLIDSCDCLDNGFVPYIANDTTSDFEFINYSSDKEYCILVDIDIENYTITIE